MKKALFLLLAFLLGLNAANALIYHADGNYTTDDNGHYRFTGNGDDAKQTRAFMGSLHVSDGAYAITLTGKLNPGTQTYFDRTDKVLYTVPGATLTLTPHHTFSQYMQCYVYLDTDQDGEFDVDPMKTEPNGDLLAFTGYDLTYSADKGDTQAPTVSSDGYSFDNMNPFRHIPDVKLPDDLTPGRYRIRFKHDWNSVAPEGRNNDNLVAQTTDADGNIIGGQNTNNGFVETGGFIIDFTIEVREPKERTLELRNPKPEAGKVSIDSDEGSIEEIDGQQVQVVRLKVSDKDIHDLHSIVANAGSDWVFTGWYILEASNLEIPEGTTPLYSESDNSKERAIFGNIVLEARFVEKSYPPMRRFYTKDGTQQNRYMKSAVATVDGEEQVIFNATTEEELPRTDYTGKYYHYKDSNGRPLPISADQDYAEAKSAGAIINKRAVPIKISREQGSFSMTLTPWLEPMLFDGHTIESQLGWVCLAYYVDWNGDNDFTDEDTNNKAYNEYHTRATITGNDNYTDDISNLGPHTISIAVPRNIEPGTYRMRLIYHEDPQATLTYLGTDWTTSIFDLGLICNGVAYDFDIEVMDYDPRTLTVTTEDEKKGTASIVGFTTSSVRDSDSHEILASCRSGYSFEGWYKVVSTDETTGEKTYELFSRQAEPTVSVTEGDIELQARFKDVEWSGVRHFYTNGGGADNSWQQNRYLQSAAYVYGNDDRTAFSDSRTVFEATTEDELPRVDAEPEANTAATSTTTGALLDKTTTKIIVPKGAKTFDVTLTAWNHDMTFGTATRATEIGWTALAYYVDWNNNGFFTDDDEYYTRDEYPYPYYEDAKYRDTPKTITVNVPDDISVGTYRMRLIYHEAEDAVYRKSLGADWSKSIFVTETGADGAENVVAIIRNGIAYDFDVEIKEFPARVLRVSSSDESMGSATIHNHGDEAIDNESHTIIARAADGYKFGGWFYEGTNTLFSDQTTAFVDVALGDITLEARFKQLSYPGVRHYYWNAGTAGKWQQNRYLKSAAYSYYGYSETIFDCTTEDELPRVDAEATAKDKATSTETGALIDKTPNNGGNEIVLFSDITSFDVTLTAWTQTMYKDGTAFPTELGWTALAYYVDWNNDYDFTDEGEYYTRDSRELFTKYETNYGQTKDWVHYYDDSKYTAEPYTITVNVPEDLEEGIYRMRLIYHEDDNSNAIRLGYDWTTDIFTTVTNETTGMSDDVVYIRDGIAYDFLIHRYGFVSGLAPVIADTDIDAPVEYYNLQGIRVAADNLTTGIYIRRQGNTVTKIAIR